MRHRLAVIVRRGFRGVVYSTSPLLMSSVTLGLARQVHHCSYGPAWGNVNDNLPEDACHNKKPEVHFGV